MSRIVRIWTPNPSRGNAYYLTPDASRGAAKLAMEASRAYKLIWSGEGEETEVPFGRLNPTSPILEIRYAVHDVNFDLLVNHLKSRKCYPVATRSVDPSSSYRGVVSPDWSTKPIRFAEVAMGHDPVYYASRTYRERWREQATPRHTEARKLLSFRGSLGKHCSKLLDYGPYPDGHYVSCPVEGCRRTRTDTFWGPDGSYRHHFHNEATGERTRIAVWPTLTHGYFYDCIGVAMGFEPLGDSLFESRNGGAGYTKLQMEPGSSLLQVFLMANNWHTATDRLNALAKAVEASWITLRSDVDLHLRELVPFVQGELASIRAAKAKVAGPARTIGGVPVSPGGEPRKR